MTERDTNNEIAQTQAIIQSAPKLIEILDAVSQTFGVGKIEIIGPHRRQNIVAARFVFFWLAKKLTIRGYTYIAKFLGDRDHATVINGVRRVEENMIYYAPRLRKAASRLNIDVTDQLPEKYRHE